MSRIRSSRTVVRLHRQQPARQGLRPLPLLLSGGVYAAAASEAALWARILAESGWADEDPAFIAALGDEGPP